MTVRAVGVARDDDDEAPRPRRSRRDEDDDDDSPRRPRNRRKSSNVLLFASIGGGVGLLLVVFLVTAFAFPGFLRSGGGATAQFLQHVPRNATIIYYVDVRNVRNRDAQSAQAMDALVEQFTKMPGMNLPPALATSVKSIDTALVAVDIDQEQVLAVLHTETPFKRDEILQMTKATDVAGKGYAQATVGGKQTLIATPDDKTLIVGVMPETNFNEVLASKAVSLAPDTQAEVNRVAGAQMWGIVMIEGKLKTELRKLRTAELQMIGAGNLASTLKRTKGLSLAQHSSAGSGARITLNATFADDNDAESVRSFGQELWDGKGKAFVSTLSTLGLVANDNEISKALNNLADDLTKTFQLSRSGSTVSASVSITEPTYLALQNVQKKGMQGAFPLAGGFPGQPAIQPPPINPGQQPPIVFPGQNNEAPSVGELIFNQAGTVKRGQRITFPIALEQNKTYAIDMESKAFDTFLELHDDKGVMLLVDDDGGPGLNSRIRFTPPRSGNYQIVARPLSNVQSGPFTVQVRKQ